jgi:hypothetical protein
MSERPLLLLDFDGPLNPYRARKPPTGYERHEIVEGEKIWSVLLNQQHGVELNTLADVFQLVWVTSWEHGANRLLAPLLGVPDDLPVIVWPEGVRELAAGRMIGPHLLQRVDARRRSAAGRLRRCQELGLRQPSVICRGGRKPFACKGCRLSSSSRRTPPRRSRPGRAGGSSFHVTPATAAGRLDHGPYDGSRDCPA